MDSRAFVFFFFLMKRGSKHGITSEAGAPHAALCSPYSLKQKTKRRTHLKRVLQAALKPPTPCFHAAVRPAISTRAHPSYSSAVRGARARVEVSSVREPREPRLRHRVRPFKSGSPSCRVYFLLYFMCLRCYFSLSCITLLLEVFFSESIRATSRFQRCRLRSC